jgi:SAM-dependent MidA family methyltransferase
MRGGVALRDGRCVAAERPVPDGLRRIVEALLSDLPQALAPDYASELNPQLEAWTAALAARLTRGLLLLIDYGYPRPLYYAPERAMGTLLCHYRHRAHDDPFLWPGLQDITASVDFTAVAEAGVAAGLDLVGYTTQGNFLIGSGMETEFEALRAAEPEGLHRLSQQVQQLTLPGEMGERFQVLGLARGLDAVPTGFSLRDLRNRL